MSIYATWLLLAADDPEFGEAGAPYVYRGSHVVPADGDKRGGSVEFGVIPNFCHPDADRETDDNMTQPVEFARLSVVEDPGTYHGGQPGDATVVLDRRQVAELRDTLTAWLETEARE